MNGFRGPWLAVRGVALTAVLSALCGVAAVAQPAADAELLAHGSGDRFWVARVHQDPQRGGAYVTDVYARPALEGRWSQVLRVEGRSLDLAHRGTQLALLLDRGWLLASEPVAGTEQTIATGRPLPPGARLLSLASRGDTILALARVYDPQPEAPPPPSAAPPPTSGPQASRDVEQLVLYSLGPQGWSVDGEFETAGPLPTGPADVSLAVVETTALIAVREGQHAVSVYRQAGAANGPRVTVETEGALHSLDLLGGGPVPVLWTVEAGGAARLHWLTRSGVQSLPVDLGGAGAAGRPVPAAGAIATERVRVVYGTGLTLSERTFDALTPAPVGGGVGTVKLPRTVAVPVALRWAEPLLTVLLLFTIVASLRRRREMQETMQAADRLPLAPFGRRFLAGVIDAAPVYGTVLVLALVANQDDDPAGYLMASVEAQAAALAALLLYLAHTTVTEIAFGRTIGKICCGLRVVALDGERPTPAALLIRNLLRLIDLSMMFFPLVLVLYSPLRQRAGDVAAGTLVVLNKLGAEAAGETPEDASEPRKDAEPVELAD